MVQVATCKHDNDFERKVKREFLFLLVLPVIPYFIERLNDRPDDAQHDAGNDDYHDDQGKTHRCLLGAILAQDVLRDGNDIFCRCRRLQSMSRV
jgi:hypothetical protein